MEIKLTTKEEQIVLDAVKDRAKVEGISEEQALRDLLAIGINNWREMQYIAQLTGRRKKDLK